MQAAKQVWCCPTKGCGYRTKPQSLSIAEMFHRCGRGKKFTALKPK